MKKKKKNSLSFKERVKLGQTPTLELERVGMVQVNYGSLGHDPRCLWFDKFFKEIVLRLPMDVRENLRRKNLKIYYFLNGQHYCQPRFVPVDRMVKDENGKLYTIVPDVMFTEFTSGTSDNEVIYTIVHELAHVHCEHYIKFMIPDTDVSKLEEEADRKVVEWGFEKELRGYYAPKGSIYHRVGTTIEELITKRFDFTKVKEMLKNGEITHEEIMRQ